MAKLSALIPAVASVLDLPEKTVAIYARHLREARLITTGGRGPGGADMTPSDCTNLLIAILGADLVKDAPKVVPNYRRLRTGRQWIMWRLPKMPLRALTRLPAFHAFGAALEGLITAAIDGSLESALEAASEKFQKAGIAVPPRIEVIVQGPIPLARISIRAAAWGEDVTYEEPNPWLKSDTPSTAAIRRWEKKIKRSGPLGDLEWTRAVSMRTILSLGQLLRK